MTKISCLFAASKTNKYIVLERFHKIGFAHLRDMLAFLDRKHGKGTYQLQFNYDADI
jgi:hypothetical protein